MQEVRTVQFHTLQEVHDSTSSRYGTISSVTRGPNSKRVGSVQFHLLLKVLTVQVVGTVQLHLLLEVVTVQLVGTVQFHLLLEVVTVQVVGTVQFHLLLEVLTVKE